MRDDVVEEELPVEVSLVSKLSLEVVVVERRFGERSVIVDASTLLVSVLYDRGTLEVG